MEAIYEFFCRPEVVQICWGLLAALPPSLASVVSVIVVPMIRKIVDAYMAKLHNKEIELDRKLEELAETVRNIEIQHGECMTELTKVNHKVKEVVDHVSRE